MLTLRLTIGPFWRTRPARPSWYCYPIRLAGAAFFAADAGMQVMARWLSLVFFGLIALAAPTLAEDASFPIGSRIGLVPPPGLVPSKNFMGYEDIDEKVAMIFVSLPAAAY